MKIQIDSKSAEFISGLGDNVYVVGGYVRNALCGFGNTDIDIAGPMPAQALKLPPRTSMTMINHRMGTAQIIHDDVRYEYTPFRVEVYDKGGEHTPVQVYFTSDMLADAQRRDFTCNAIYYDVKNDELVDPLGGIRDCEAKILRGCHKRVFESDGLRLLRLVRQAAQLGFKIEGETAMTAKANAKNLADITTERKRAELDKILCADTANGIANAQYRGLKLLKQFDLWQYLIPEMLELDGLEQPSDFHKYDVLEHSLRAACYVPPNISLRLAALLHDIGKGFCMRNFGNFHGHERSSEITARIVLNRLRYPKDIVDQVSRLCRLHMYDMRGDAKDSKVRLFVAKNYDILDKLVTLIRADKRATGMADLDEINAPHRFEKVREQMISEGTPILKRTLKISGKDLADMGFEGAAISAAIETLWRECVVNPSLNNSEWLHKMAERLDKRIEEEPVEKKPAKPTRRPRVEGVRPTIQRPPRSNASKTNQTSTEKNVEENSQLTSEDKTTTD